MPRRGIKKSREQFLRQKREAERLRYERIKNDPILRAEQKLKEREKYEKKKEKKTGKLNHEMTHMGHIQIPSEDQVQEQESDEQSPLPVSFRSRTSIFSPPPPMKKFRTTDPLVRQNELLQKVCSFLEEPNEPSNNMPTIAKVWGEILLTLDPQQRILAEKAVNDVLFEARQGTLQRNSIKINENTKFGAVQQPSSNVSQSHHSTSSRYNLSDNYSNNDED